MLQNFNTNITFFVLRSVVNPNDAEAVDLQATLTMPSGVGASCVLKDTQNLHPTGKSEEYNDGCRWLFDIDLKQESYENMLLLNDFPLYMGLDSMWNNDLLILIMYLSR